MPYAMELKLLPLNERPLPDALSYNSYALFLSILRNSAPTLATRLHELDGPKPFTVAIMPPYHRGKRDVPAGMPAQLALRLTFLDDAVFTGFLKSALEWDNRKLQLGSAQFKAEQIRLVDMHKPRKSSSSYEELLSAATTERTIALHFLSPTVFRSKGTRNTLFPQSELVFGSLFNRWNAFSPLKLDTGLRQCFEAHILLARYRLQTAMLNFAGYQEAGFTGRCNYLLDNALTEEQLRSINALADFAFYSGVGAKTTMGMGQARREKSGSALSNRTGSNTEKGR